MVHARVELADGARSVGTNPGLLGEFGEQRLEILHPLRIRTTASGSGPGPRSEEPRLNSSHVSLSYAAFCLKKEHRDPPPVTCEMREIGSDTVDPPYR